MSKWRAELRHCELDLLTVVYNRVEGPRGGIPDERDRLIMHLRKLLDDREEVNEKAIALLQGKIRPTAWDVL